jgi:hypothetical protein
MRGAGDGFEPFLRRLALYSLPSGAEGKAMAMSAMGQVILSMSARSLEGCHYLWGSAGATPGGTEGADYRRGLVTLDKNQFDPKGCCVAAARCDADGYYVCGGRWQTFSGGRAAKPTDNDLQNYLSAQKVRAASGLPPEPYFVYFTPRSIKTKGTNGTQVWGEDCRGKRHFDCIGFVNFVISLVCRKDRTFGGKGFSGDIAWHKANAKAVKAEDPAVAGDILAPEGNGHIAILLMDGYVAQAESTDRGVTITPYRAQSWAFRGRHSDYFFH